MPRKQAEQFEDIWAPKKNIDNNDNNDNNEYKEGDLHSHVMLEDEPEETREEDVKEEPEKNNFNQENNWTFYQPFSLTNEPTNIPRLKWKPNLEQGESNI